MILNISQNFISVVKSPFVWLGILLFIILAGFIVKKITKNKKKKELPLDTEEFGFAYDEKQGIFYSTKDAWQRKFGYCRLYDEAAPAAGMIIDCEPVYFEYDGKRWMIEFWKGQYGGVTGCEVGVYTAKGPEIDIPGVLEGGFYRNDSEADYLEISVTLFKRNRMLFTRKDTHWWITGFCLGMFSQPEELLVRTVIRFKDEQMQKAFVAGLVTAGYSESEYRASGSTAFVIFDKPHTSQPTTRTEKIEEAVQSNNKRLCEAIQTITAGISDSMKQLELLEKEYPDLYRELAAALRPSSAYRGYRLVEKELRSWKEGGQNDVE